MNGKLSEFPRGTSPPRADTSSRVTSGLLTAIVYAVFALLLWFASVAPPAAPSRPEIVIAMVRETAKKPQIDPAPPFPDARSRPAERPAPPVVTLATGAPPQAPAPLPASAAQVSPLAGGTAGDGTMGQAGGGAGGTGTGGGGCLDPVWMAAVSERVRQFFYYPGAALASRITGVVTIRFGVRRDGRIDRLEIGKSSGDDSLDRAATDILQKAQPLPPIPDRMQRDRVDGELPVNFGVRNFNARPDMGNCRS